MLCILSKDYDIKMIDGQINDTRIIGMITNVILLAIALIGMTWESKVINLKLDKNNLKFFWTY